MYVTESNPKLTEFIFFQHWCRQIFLTRQYNLGVFFRAYIFFRFNKKKFHDQRKSLFEVSWMKRILPNNTEYVLSYMTRSKWKICIKMTLVYLTTFSILKTKISDKVRKNPPSLYYFASLFSLVTQQKMSVNKLNGRNNVFWSAKPFLF